MDEMNRRNPFDWRIILILLMALVVRLAWVWHLPADENYLQRLPDQVEYLSLGRSLLHGQGLSFTDSRFADTVYAYRVPGYPWFIAICRGCGLLVRIAKAILDLSSVLAVYWLVRRCLIRVSATFSAIIIALNPFLIYF